mmetsp:Transcript_22031/g.50288  ORF Transcript_22031/g.50288 Transcript_22031/m.50288 type:complete len:132 (-) Transcript_22031:108-503(-)
MARQLYIRVRASICRHLPCTEKQSIRHAPPNPNVSRATGGGYELETGAMNLGYGSGRRAVALAPRGEGARGQMIDSGERGPLPKLLIRCWLPSNDRCRGEGGQSVLTDVKSVLADVKSLLTDVKFGSLDEQ